MSNFDFLKDHNEYLAMYGKRAEELCLRYPDSAANTLRCFLEVVFAEIASRYGMRLADKLTAGQQLSELQKSDAKEAVDFKQLELNNLVNTGNKGSHHRTGSVKKDEILDSLKNAFELGKWARDDYPVSGDSSDVSVFNYKLLECYDLNKTIEVTDEEVDPWIRFWERLNNHLNPNRLSFRVKPAKYNYAILDLDIAANKLIAGTKGKMKLELAFAKRDKQFHFKVLFDKADQKELKEKFRAWTEKKPQNTVFKDSFKSVDWRKEDDKKKSQEENGKGTQIRRTVWLAATTHGLNQDLSNSQFRTAAFSWFTNELLKVERVFVDFIEEEDS